MMKLEIEVKFRIDDPDEIARKLAGLGAKKVGEGFENNLVFDRNGEFEKSGKLLRLRSHDGKCLITYKQKKPSDRFKYRDELDLVVADFARAKMLLEVLGFGVVHIYEKKRTTFKLRDVEVMIDTVPFLGNFIEIEGTKQGIAATAKKLGFDMDDTITVTYDKLFRDYCREKGIGYCDMVFKEGEK